jgi:hypothetical protein
MWNTWSERQCDKLFGDRAPYIWGKWIECCMDNGRTAAAAIFWSLVDEGIQEALVEQANQ